MNLRRFQYTHDRNLPFVALTLSYADHSIQREALIDSGSTNNLMPYQVGLDYVVASLRICVDFLLAYFDTFE